MAGKCRVCRSPRRQEVETAILEGEPQRSIAARLGPSKTAIARHAAAHMETKLATARATEELTAESLYARVLSLQRETEAILSEARKAKDHNLALSAVKRAQALIETQGKILVAARGGTSPTGDDRIEAALAELRRRREQRRAITTSTVPEAPAPPGDAKRN
jgi:hypothetical protein